MGKEWRRVRAGRGVMLAARYFTARLQPGVYALICFIDNLKDHQPHFMHGMQQQFTVQRT